MGKKSSSKKQKLHEKNVSPDTKAPAPRGRFAEWTREKWLATGLMVVALVMLSFAAVVSWIHLMQPKPISLLVPKDTIAIAEIDTDLADTQWEKYNALTNNGIGLPAVGDLIGVLNTALHVDLTKDIYPWLARRASVALLADFKPALFLEIKDQPQALAYFQNRRLEGTSEQFQQKEYRGTTFYQYVASSPFSIFSIGGYLVIAGDESSAKRIVDAAHDKNETLYAQLAYQHIASAFPDDRLAFVYGKPGYLKLLAGDTSAQFPTSATSQSSITPLVPSSQPSPQNSLQQLTQTLEQSFSSILAGEGMSIKALDDKLLIEHLALFSDATRAAKIFLKLPQKYQAHLAEFFSPETEFFTGGENMPLVMQKFATLIASKETSQQAIETNINAQITEFFGGKLTTQEFATLTQHEYAIGLDHGAMKIAIALTGTEQEKDRLLKKLMYALQWKLLNTQLTSRVIGDVGIIASSQESLADATDLWSHPEKPNFKTSQVYQQIITPQMQSSDDIIFAKPASLQNFLPDSLAFLKNIPALSIGSTAFEDGMKTTMLIAPINSSNTSANGS